MPDVCFSFKVQWRRPYVGVIILIYDFNWFYVIIFVYFCMYMLDSNTFTLDLCVPNATGRPFWFASKAPMQWNWELSRIKTDNTCVNLGCLMPAWEILVWMDWFVLPIKNPMVKKSWGDVSSYKIIWVTTAYLSNHHKGGNLPREDPTSLGPKLERHSRSYGFIWTFLVFLLLTLNRSTTSVCGKSMKKLDFCKLRGLHKHPPPLMVSCNYGSVHANDSKLQEWAGLLTDNQMDDNQIELEVKYIHVRSRVYSIHLNDNNSLFQSKMLEDSLLLQDGWKLSFFD